jgi:hypothetical protein
MLAGYLFLASIQDTERNGWSIVMQLGVNGGLMAFQLPFKRHIPVGNHPLKVFKILYK